MGRIKYVVNIVIVAILFVAIAISRDGRILGVDTQDLFGVSDTGVEELLTPVEVIEMDGTRVINSESLSTDIVGFAGRTPINLYIKDGVVVKVEALPNSETPSFFDKVTSSGLMSSWDGKSLDEALTTQVDMVSGATYSSRAIEMNVQRAIAYGSSVAPQGRGLLEDVDLKFFVGLFVILIGVLLTILKSHNRVVDIVYMILNVIVLGFWCGSFLSLSQVVSWASNGFSLSLSLLLLLVVILLPIFGHKGSYCHHHCPLGSAQELMGRIALPQLKISPSVNKALSNLRVYILMALLFMMWIGVGFEIMDYELFTAFMVGSASNIVLSLAAIFLVLSLFIKRPYCRFVCPTGALIVMMQKTKD